MNNTDVCAIWDTWAKGGPVDGRDGVSLDSPRAGGRYFISGSAKAVIGDRDEAFKARLTTWLVDQRRFGVQCPKISTNTLDEIRRHPALPVPDRMLRLLKHINANLRSIGHAVEVLASETDDITLLRAEILNNITLAMTGSLKIGEVIYLLDTLEHKGLIEKVESETPYWYAITIDGYAHLIETETRTVVSQQAFVAMWFDDSMDGLYEQAIRPAISSAGYMPLRIDKADHNNKIDDQIIAEIKRSRFIVADFTHREEEGVRGGVYYEAGFAHGMNIPVIFTCREDMIEEIHFDTRQYNHILWEDGKLDEFKETLSRRISATIGDGPLKK